MSKSTLDELRDELTPNQRVFCDEYLKDRNGTRAYLAAYKNVKSENTAAVEASKNLRKPKLKKYLDAISAQLAEKNEITVSRILKEEARLAFSDLGDIFNGRTTIPPDQLPEDVRRAIAGVEVTTRTFDDGSSETTYKYKFWDKGKALQRLERHLGMDGQGDESIEKGLRELGDRLERAIRRSARDK